MIYKALFDHLPDPRPVRVALVGSGQFGTAVVTQSQFIPLLEVSVIVETSEAAARTAFRHAGIADEDIVLAGSRADALRAMESGRRVIVEDASLVMDLPIDIVAESTGDTAAGARHARMAIENGKHVAMISKETDSTVGPILHHLANKAGLIYTPVDGDQHGLLVGLLEWAEMLGLEVLCGGKARDTEFVYDPATGRTEDGRRETVVPEAERRWLNADLDDTIGDTIAKRHSILAALPPVGNNDITELAIMANGTGLMPDIPSTHRPALHTREIPQAFAPKEDGGILTRRGVVDVVTSLHQGYEPGLGGGVFITVACENDYSRMILTTKGLISNRKGNSMLIYKPYHLCGVETPISLLCATLLNAPTGSRTSRPHVDMVAIARRALKPGETVGGEKSPELKGHLVPAAPLSAGGSVPFYLASGCKLVREVPEGENITLADIEPPRDCDLWALREQQDREFLS